MSGMPTENGQGQGSVSMSGGWLLSVGSHATNKQMAFNFITMALDTRTRCTMTSAQPRSRAVLTWLLPLLQGVQRVDTAFSRFVPFTHFRPAFSAYPKLSNEIQVITGQVMTGQATPAQGVARTTSTSSHSSGRARSDQPLSGGAPPKGAPGNRGIDPVRM